MQTEANCPKTEFYIEYLLKENIPLTILVDYHEDIIDKESFSLIFKTFCLP